MNLRIVIEYDKQTDSYSSVCPELPGCCSYGETEEDALNNIREAIDLYLSPDEEYMISENAHIFQVAL